MKRSMGLMRIALCAACALGVIILAGCAPHAPSEEAGRDGVSQPTEVEFIWSTGSDCSMCHAEESSSMTVAGHLAAVHEAEGETCTSCHADQAALSEVHKEALPSSTAPKRLAKTRVSDELCLGCHDKGELTIKTVESAVLTDSQGLVENPHALPETESHSAITCSDCHKMHSSETVAQTSKTQCLSCHHEDVFECGTCHEEM